MRRTASERLEIIRLVEDSELPIRNTLRHLGVARSTFYDWYKRFLDDGPDGLEDKKPSKRRHWNRLPQGVKDDLLRLALERTDLSARELAFTYTDKHHYFV
jgi:putative transposase